MKGWVNKQVLLAHTHAGSIEQWVQQQPYSTSIPCNVVMAGKKLQNRKDGFALIEVGSTNGTRAQVNVPPSAVNVSHRFTRHSVRLDLLPLVDELQRLSSTRHWREKLSFEGKTS